MRSRRQRLLCYGFWLVLFSWIYAFVSYTQHSLFVVAVAAPATLVFTIVAVIEIAMATTISATEKILWIIVLVIFSLLSCMVYYLMDWRSELLFPRAGDGKESPGTATPPVLPVGYTREG